MDYKAPSELCSQGCGRPRRERQRLCQECHASYMRAWRKGHKRAMAKVAEALAAAGIRVPELGRNQGRT